MRVSTATTQQEHPQHAHCDSQGHPQPADRAPRPAQHRQPAEPRMSPVNAPNTAHLMPGEAVPDIVTACRLMQLGFMHPDYPLSGQPVPVSPASSAIKLQAAACAGGAVFCLRRGAAGRRAHAGPRAVDPRATGASGGGDHRPDAEAGAGLADLAYELLDAHTDTAQLVDGLPYDPSRAAHLDYLRALQRKGREVLARAAPEELSPCHRDDVGSLDVR